MKSHQIQNRFNILIIQQHACNIQSKEIQEHNSCLSIYAKNTQGVDGAHSLPCVLIIYIY
jgi:hypothetical protein